MRRGRGYTLAESLVAMVLLAVGLLGAASAVLQALRHERVAADRAAAVRTAESLAEELRLAARPDGRALLSVTGVTPAVACADHAPSCAAETSAAAALADAEAVIRRALPSPARLQVRVPAAEHPSYRIEIRWPDGGLEPARIVLAAGP